MGISLPEISLKKSSSIFVTLALVASLGFTVYLVQSSTKQDLRSRAAENTLMGVFSAQSAGKQSVIDNLILPSILGFQSDTFTGDSSVNYSFDIPQGPGGLAPSLGLVYSSSYVSDYATGLEIRHADKSYFQQASLAGFGWQTTGIGQIEKNRNSEDKNEIRYTINLGGVSYRLIQGSDGRWTTSPDSFFQIYHQPCSGGTYADDTGYWEIKDKSGTKYLFGASSGENCKLQTAGNQHLSTAWRIVSWKDPENPNFRSELEAYKWMLRRVEDIHGNTISYSYNQEWKDIKNCPYTGPNSYPEDLRIPGTPTNGFYSYTTTVYPDKINYGNVEIRLEYEDRPDWQISPNPDATPPAWADACYTGYFAKKRIKSVKILRNGQQYSSYDLVYKPDNEVKSVFEVCPVDRPADPGCYPNEKKKVAHSLLAKVIRHGTNPNSSLPAYSFTYNDGLPGSCLPRSGNPNDPGVTCPNQILLTRADNGYGGSVSYAYETGQSDVKLCSLSYDGMPPGINPCDPTGRLRVKNKTVKDEVTGKSSKISYHYTNGLAKFDKAEEDLSSFDGYEFLGYGKVVETTSEFDKPSSLAKIIRSSFYQAKTTGAEGLPEACFNPDIKKGKPYKVETLDKNFNPGNPFNSGTILAYSENAYSTSRGDTACTTDYKVLNTTSVPAVYPIDAKSTVDGLTTQIKYDYDQYGNQTLVENLGFTNINDDSRYTITKYVYNTAKNILNKPYIQTISSDRNGKNVLSVVKTFYDEFTKNSELGKIGDRGLPIKIVSGKKNQQTYTASEEDTITGATITDIENDDPEEGILGVFTDEVQAATQLKVYAKIGSQTGPPFNLTGKFVRLTKLSGACSNLCTPSCSDPVCKNRDKTYNPGKGFVQWPDGTTDATYTFRMMQLDIGWTQDSCTITNYPQNTACTIVLHSPSISISPVPSSPVPSPIPSISLSTTPSPLTSIPLNTTVSIIRNEYDKYGNIIKTTDPSKHSTEISYDDSHIYPVQTKQRVNGKDWTSTTKYDPVLKKPVKTVDINGAVTQLRYDEFGRLKKAWGPDDSQDSPTIKTSYNEPSKSSDPLKVKIELLSSKNPDKYLSSFSFYNGLGQEIENKVEWDGGKNKVAYTSFNSLGQTEYSVIPFLDTASIGSFIFDNRVKNPPSGQKTASFFDLLGRAVRVENPDGTRVQTDYRANTVTTFDANDPNKSGRNKKVSIVNAYGETEKIEEYKDGQPYFIQTYKYDKAGRLIRTKDPGGHLSKYTYDILGRKIIEQNADNGTIRYTYDASGNLLSKTDNTGQTILLSYDDGNRVISRKYPDGTQVNLKYDEGKKQLGKLTSVTNPSATIKYSYNLKGELTKESKTIAGDSQSYETQYAYDAAGRVVKTRYPDGEEVSQTYTVSSLPDTLSSNLGKYIVSSVYNAQGQLTSRQFANNTRLTQNYDPRSFRLTDIILNPFYHTSYSYDSVGNIQKITNNSQLSTINYTYDGVYRLTGASGGYTSTYAYDIDGNITTKNEAESVSLGYTGSSPIHAPKTVNGKTLTYDGNGNLIQDDYSNLKITYDYENRPIEIQSLSTTNYKLQTKYYYDGEGKRVKKESFENGTLKTTTYYINQYFEKEITNGGSPKVRKFYAGIAFREGDTLTYSLADHLSSTTLLTNSQGQKTGDFRYYPYGSPILNSQLTTNNLPPNSWIGQKLDTESGLYFLNARYYSPITGRFIQGDPVDDKSARNNRYLYSANNPIVNADPLGNDCDSTFFPCLPEATNPSGSDVPYFDNFADFLGSIGGTADTFLYENSPLALSLRAAEWQQQNPGSQAMNPYIERIGFAVAGMTTPIRLQGSGTYVAHGGEKLIIDPGKDAGLQQFVNDLTEYVIQNRKDISKSRAPLVKDFIYETVRYTENKKEIYARGGGTAELGSFYQCRIAVCREMAALNHVGLASQGKDNYMVTGHVAGGNHAWVEYFDTNTGQRMVSDATNGWILPANEAYQFYGGHVLDIKKLQFVTPQ